MLGETEIKLRDMIDYPISRTFDKNQEMLEMADDWLIRLATYHYVLHLAEIILIRNFTDRDQEHLAKLEKIVQVLETCKKSQKTIVFGVDGVLAHLFVAYFACNFSEKIYKKAALCVSLISTDGFVETQVADIIDLNDDGVIADKEKIQRFKILRDTLMERNCSNSLITFFDRILGEGNELIELVNFPKVKRLTSDVISSEEVPKIKSSMSDNTEAAKKANSLPSYTSSSQREILTELKNITHTYFTSDWKKLPFRPRFRPMIIGPSGVGKSHLIRLLSHDVQIPLLRLTFGDWIVIGSWNGTPTLDVVFDFVKSNEKGIIHLDELEKVGNFMNSVGSWTRSVNIEILNLCDGSISYSSAAGNKKIVWEASLLEKLRDQFLIIGSGTWQHLWKHVEHEELGFHHGAYPESKVARLKAAIDQEDLLPPEILFRFNQDILFLHPLTYEDAKEICSYLKTIPELEEFITDDLAKQAVASKQNMRFFEEILGKSIIRQHISKTQKTA